MTSDPRRRPPVLMLWNETSGAYEAAVRTACVARWKSAGRNRAAGDLCGRPMFRRVGDFTLCRHHWERMWGDGFSAFAEEEISELRARWGEERQRSESMRQAGQQAERAERRRTAGHIYYVRRVSDGLIKIGTTQSLKQRLGTLRGQYGEMEVLLTHDGGSDQETELHRRFDAWQVRGEWFHPGRPLFTWILQQRRDHSIRGTQLREAVGITGLEALRVGSLAAPPPRRYIPPKRRAS